MAQFLRPDSNITQTSYTGGFAEIDEVTASDTDLAFGGVNSATPLLLVHLSNPASTPQSGTCTVRWRSARRNAAGTINSGNAFTGTCTLLEGTTTIASDAYTPGAYSTRSFTFTHGSVTDWTNLRLQFTQTASGGTGNNRSGLAVSWAEVETPDGLAAYSLTADKGTFTLTGVAADLKATHLLTADTRALTVSGVAATIKPAFKIVGDKGTYTVTRNDATLLTTKVLSASSGVFTLTGKDADIHYVAGIDFNVDVGQFLVQGVDAVLTRGITLTASTRAFYVTGNTANLVYVGTSGSSSQGAFYQVVTTNPKQTVIPTENDNQLVYYINDYLRIL